MVWHTGSSASSARESVASRSASPEEMELMNSGSSSPVATDIGSVTEDGIWPVANPLWVQLRAARASLGDEDEQLRLQLSREQLCLRDLEKQEAKQSKELCSLREELPALLAECQQALESLENSEKQRADSEAMLQKARGTGKDLHCPDTREGRSVATGLTAVRHELEHLKRSSAEVAMKLQTEESVCQALLTHASSNTASLHQAERNAAINQKELQNQIANEEANYSELKSRLRSEKTQVLLFAEHERHSEAKVQRAVQDEARSEERTRAQIRRVANDIRQTEEASQARWSEKMARQVAQREDKNWQLQRRIAEASKALRASETSHAQASESFQVLKLHWQNAQEIYATQTKRCSQAREQCARADAEVAAHRQQLMEEKTEARQRQIALAADLRAQVQAKKVALEDASERILRAEVDEIHEEVAQEARWLQTEISNLHYSGSAVSSARRTPVEEFQSPSSWVPPGALKGSPTPSIIGSTNGHSPWPGSMSAPRTSDQGSPELKDASSTRGPQMCAQDWKRPIQAANSQNWRGPVQGVDPPDWRGPTQAANPQDWRGPAQAANPQDWRRSLQAANTKDWRGSVQAVSPAVEARQQETEALHAQLSKHLDELQSRQFKLDEEEALLREQLDDARISDLYVLEQKQQENSREVRRVSRLKQHAQQELADLRVISSGRPPAGCACGFRT